MPESGKYLKTLLSYYEDEVMGEAYFYGLADHFEEQEKLELLARVERHAANSVVPLLEKYGLIPRTESELLETGKGHVDRHESFSWPDFISHMLKRYPGYLDDFAALKAMAPEEDWGPLDILTEHEVAAIEFAEREMAGDPDSMAPLQEYLEL